MYNDYDEEEELECRDLPSIYSTVHRTRNRDRNDIHRHAFSFLLSIQRSHLPALRRPEENASAPHAFIPLPPLLFFRCLLNIVEVETTLLRVGPPVIRRSSNFLYCPFPIRDDQQIFPSSTGISRNGGRRLVCAVDAVAGGSIHISECFLDDNVKKVVLPKIWYMGRFYNIVLCVLWCSFYL